MVLLIGFLFGFVGSIPVAGPVSILVFSRAMEGRLRHGVWIAVGAAIAEAGYAFLAFLGFTSLLARYSWIQPAMKLGATVILIALGVSLVLKKKKKSSHQPISQRTSKQGSKRSFFLGFSIAAMNPTLLATWTAAIATLLSMEVIPIDFMHAFPFSTGVCLGIISWFAIVLLLAKRYHSRISTVHLQRLIRVMGGVLIVIGLSFGLSVYLR